MFNTGSQPTITKLVVDSADSGIELADSSAGCCPDLARIGVWVRALSFVNDLNWSPTVYLILLDGPGTLC